MFVLVESTCKVFSRNLEKIESFIYWKESGIKGDGSICQIIAALAVNLSSSALQYLCKEPSMVACDGDLSTGKRRVFGTSWLTSLVQLVSSRFGEKTYLKK